MTILLTLDDWLVISACGANLAALLIALWAGKPRPLESGAEPNAADAH